MKDLLIEIGVEELPPKAVQKLGGAFACGIEQGLQKENLSFSAVKYYATPRRLAVLVENLADKQENQVIERRGPAWQAAFDEKGKPTAATLGFAKSCGAKITDLKRIETEKGSWVFYKQKKPGIETIKLIPDITKQALKTLPIPRLMRWGEGSEEFVRPVHWVVILYGNKVIKTTVLGIKTGQETRGHRFHYPHRISITKPKEYAAILEKKGFVIADFAKRKNIIRKQIKKISADAVIDEELLDEVTGLVEWPVALQGVFKKHFLDLPKEVLISTMQKHQKYFHLQNKKGDLLPHFIVISNIKSRRPKQVISGNEKVINARLTDAEFFYHSDLKKPLEENVEKLKGLIFQTDLGSMYDKTVRLEHLAEYIAKQIGADTKETKQAAQLSKADLLTTMVGEFPDLQGIMGYYYTKIVALKEQYLPRFSGDDLPKTKVGQALAIADRIDTLVGIFGINQLPTGDKDPYGLRRAALGILRIIIEQELELDLFGLVNKALNNYTSSRGDSTSSRGLTAGSRFPAFAGNDEEKAGNDGRKILDFLFERLRFWYLEQGVSANVFAAVLARFPTAPLDFAKRIQAVIGFQKLPAAESLAVANKRVSNILKKSGAVTNKINTDLLLEKEEQDLAKQIEEQEKIIHPLCAEKDYAKVLAALAKLKDPVDKFFDKVLVMAEEKNLQNNRLALLTKLRSLFLNVADISLL